MPTLTPLPFKTYAYIDADGWMLSHYAAVEPLPREGYECVEYDFVIAPQPNEFCKYKWDTREWIDQRSPQQQYDDAADAVRSERDRKLYECDWTQGKDIPDEKSQAWAPYRQELRDVTAQPGFPFSIVWPQPPSTA